MEKKIYSLNLIAYIIYETATKPVLRSENNTVFAIFPETAEIAAAISQFKKDSCTVELHKLINIFKDLKKEIRGVKNA